jgi:tetratricopeptide (TPR) repeat protein
MIGALLVFIVSFGVYLTALPPALAPYRDAGEMATSAFTLGVSHPTSYPLYILLGRLMNAVPLGNPAYRLSLLSALAGAAALAVIYQCCAKRWGPAAGLGAAVLLGLNGTFWSVAVVQEMYTLWMLAAASLLAVALNLRDRYEERLWLGFCLLYGLCLANRLDLVLWAPGLLWLALGSWEETQTPLWASLCFLVFPALLVVSDKNAMIVPLILGTVLWRYRGPGRAAWALRSMVFAAAGLALYAYLPLRSGRAPWLDWNHPMVFANFLESVLRSKYGGTLDLLSKNYAKGALFGDNMVLYGRHLWENFSLIGLALAAAGSFVCARRDGRRWLGMAAAYWWSGPLFLFMANMPPNPHAAAIVDPHYLASDLILVFWAAEGIALLELRPAALAVVSLLALVPFLSGRWDKSARRFHFFSYDYAKNVLMSVPPSGTLVAKKDVQLYTLWYYQTVQGWRPDVRVVAQGLSGSPWYQASWHRRDSTMFLLPLRGADEWKSLAGVDAPAFASMDSDLPSEIKHRGWGMVWRVSPDGPDSPPASELMARRGDYSYERQPDFFTSDLIGDYATAAYAAGSELYAQKHPEEAAERLTEAWSMHWLYAEPAVFLGFKAFQERDYRSAQRFYSMAAALSQRLLGLAGDYRALPGVADNFRRSTAENITQLGVISERLGDVEGAKSLYRQAMIVYPLAQAHYNLAVLSWGKDWDLVEREMEETLRLDPGNGEAAKYLAAVRARKR